MPLSSSQLTLEKIYCSFCLQRQCVAYIPFVTPSTLVFVFQLETYCNVCRYNRFIALSHATKTSARYSANNSVS